MGLVSIRVHIGMTSATRASKKSALLTIDHLSLLVEPALRGVTTSLQDDMVALQATGQVVPCCGNHGVLPLEVLDDDLLLRLENCGVSITGPSTDMPGTEAYATSHTIAHVDR